MDASEIERMVKEAETNAEADKARREGIDSRNALDGLVYETEKQVDEHREKIPVSDLSAVEGAVEAAKEILKNENASADELKASVETLQAAMHKVSETLYKQEAADAGAQPDGSSSASDGSDGSSTGPADDADVVDAEFTEEK